MIESNRIVGVVVVVVFVLHGVRVHGENLEWPAVSSKRSNKDDSKSDKDNEEEEEKHDDYGN